MPWPTRSAGCSPRAAQILDVLELEARGAADPVASEGLAGTVQFLSDLCHTQAAQAAGEVSRICAELVFGYNRHPAWDEEEHRSCFLASELEEYEETMPGISAMAVDVIAADGSHPHKAGPCAGCAGSAEFLRLQSKAHHLPQRVPPGQGPRRRHREQSHDSRSAGLPRMSEAAQTRPPLVLIQKTGCPSMNRFLIHGWDTMNSISPAQ